MKHGKAFVLGVLAGTLALFLALSVKLSRVPFNFIVRGLKAIVFLLLISISFGYVWQ